MNVILTVYLSQVPVSSDLFVSSRPLVDKKTSCYTSSRLQVIKWLVMYHPMSRP